MTITSDLIDSRYRILRNIGNGSMGSVFLVHDEKLDKLWAAKLVRNISSNELLALKSVNHQAFPRLVDSINEKDYIWLIMDYMEGASLKEYMNTARVGKIQFKDIALQLAQAIDYLHTMTPTMLYLDCKPDNIIIDKHGILHMIDLGSIYLVNQSNPGRISGTAGFASPEQRMGKVLDVRSDIYSYGMTLKSIMPGPDTPNVLISVIKKCIAQSPSKRFQSMHEILECITRPELFIKISLRTSVLKCVTIILYIVFTLFIIIGFQTYSHTQNSLFLLLSTTLFSALILLMQKFSQSKLSSNWNCNRDIYLSRGLRTLPVIIPLLVSLLISKASATAAPIHEYTDDAYRVTLYTGNDEKILYYGQSLHINPDGSATLSIPVSSLTPESIPAKMELIRKY